MAALGPGETDDLAKLPRLDAQVILNELKHRYSKDKIYTYVGDILIAVNPFKTLKIYDKNASHKYKEVVKSTEPPHIFAVADAAYQAMLGKGGARPHHQCCVISGESGAGKTESAKFIINQIIELSHGESQLEQQILQVNPLLEAFGNAQTVMNDNSSRFGKYIQLKFLNGGVIGAKISEYLLEKSRIAVQNNGEENFHIFYYLFAGLSQEELQKYSFSSPKSYSYLSNGYSSKNVKRNKDMFNQLMNAIDLVGFLEEEQTNMFLLLSLVLNMGNIVIEEDDEDNALVKDQEVLNVAAKLFGTDVEKVKNILTSTSTTTKGSIIKRRLKKHQALDVRDATAKALYGRLFSWIVNKINRLLAPPAMTRGENVMEIGILDIFGFEHFEMNSFEQSCINLANEQLQFFFNQHIFMWEQEEYKREGIDWTTITYEDNKPVLDLFLEKPIGLLALLDEESHFPQSTDETFVQKLVKNCGKSKHLVTSRQSQLSKFTIVHYAGKVEYDSYGFLEKNRDTLPQSVTEALEKSNNELISTIFTGTITRTGTLAIGKMGGDPRMRKSRVAKPARQLKPNTKKATVSSQFRTSLTVLMEKLTAAHPHFIRCIKPNHMKASGNFNNQYVEDQLKYTGVLETTRIRREGYPVRPTFEEFVDSYKLIVYDPFLKPSESSSRRILKKSKLTDWHIGKTKVFLKYWQTEELAKKLEEVYRSVIKMQKVVRGFLVRRRKKRLVKAAEENNLKAKDCLQLIRMSSSDMNRGIAALKEKRRIELIPQRNNTKYASIDFGKTNQATASAGTGTNTFKSIDEVRFVDEGVCDFDIGEDEFVREQDPTKAKFGAVTTKETAVQWYQETQAPKGAGMETHGVFHDWFHGVISRKRSEMLLTNKPLGCFLVRVSESRFGYSLSYRVSTRCKHYMIDQTRSGKYLIVGLPKVFKSLNELVEYHHENRINDEGDLLKEPCGQENEDEADYVDLLSVVGSPRRVQPQADLVPPALPERRYKSTMRN